MMDNREIDKLVAEKVMGLIPCDQWERFNLGSAGGPALMKKCNHKNGECYPTLEFKSLGGKIGGCPAYSTDIAAAWLVVEKTNSLDLGKEENYQTLAKFMYFVAAGGTNLLFLSSSEAAKRISQAALRAVGVEVG